MTHRQQLYVRERRAVRPSFANPVHHLCSNLPSLRQAPALSVLLPYPVSQKYARIHLQRVPALQIPQTTAAHRHSRSRTGSFLSLPRAAFLSTQKIFFSAEKQHVGGCYVRIHQERRAILQRV